MVELPSRYYWRSLAKYFISLFQFLAEMMKWNEFEKLQSFIYTRRFWFLRHRSEVQAGSWTAVAVAICFSVSLPVTDTVLAISISSNISDELPRIC